MTYNFYETRMYQWSDESGDSTTCPCQQAVDIIATKLKAEGWEPCPSNTIDNCYFTFRRPPLARPVPVPAKPSKEISKNIGEALSPIVGVNKWRLEIEG